MPLVQSNGALGACAICFFGKCVCCPDESRLLPIVFVPQGRVCHVRHETLRYVQLQTVGHMIPCLSIIMYSSQLIVFYCVFQKLVCDDNITNNTCVGRKWNL
jgi:hypothetical protein